MADVIFPGRTAPVNLGASKLPGNMDLSIWKGDAQRFLVTLTDANAQPIPLTGCTAQATIRASFESTPAHDFTCTIQNGNQVLLYMSSPVSEAIPAGDYVWNFQITDSTGDVRTYLAGDVTVLPEVD